MSSVRITTAGAGSGKTTELTRIMRDAILSGEVRPEAIIATTFTTAAAGELAERVRRILFASGQIAAAARMEESLVGTVHSICARLLGRFAFEAGISPQPEVMDEVLAGTLVSEAIESAITLETVQEMERLSRKLSQVDHQTAQTKWKSQVRDIISRAREGDHAVTELAAMAESSLAGLTALLPTPTTQDLDDLLADALTQVNTQGAAPGDETDKTLKALQAATNACRDLEHGNLSWAQWWQLAKTEPGKKSETVFDPVVNTASRVESHPRLREDLCGYVMGIFRIAGQALDVYQRRKEERALLDFADLEVRALRLLDDERVQQAIREDYDLLLVDEFQDTNPLQLALFLKLASLVRVRTVWVGDLKQAIYGFRGSDPELMLSVVELIRRQGGLNPPLDKTYRARPELAELFNSIFVPAFGESHKLDSSEVRLEAHRKPHPGLPAPLQLWSCSSGQQNKNGSPKAPTIPQLVQCIAAGVNGLLKSGIQTQDRDSGEIRAITAGDIAILCRTNPFAEKIAGALLEAGLTVSRETSGLLSTPEASLAIACLRRLMDPRDTLASAEIIALEGTRTAEEWLQNRLEWLALAGNEDAQWGLSGELVHPALVALESAREKTLIWSPKEALDAGLRLGDVFGAVSVWGPTETRAAQRRANLEALRGMAATYEGQCITLQQPATLTGFLIWCQSIKDDGVAVDDQADAVQVLTYHGAKGLEWPVVICTELAKEPRPRLWDQLVTIQEAPFDPLRPLAGRHLRFWPWPFGKQEKGVPLGDIADASATGQAALNDAIREELRLLYVGFTRARDVLVLAGKEGEQPAWLDLLPGAPFTNAFVSGDEQTRKIAGIQCPIQRLKPSASVGSAVPQTELHWFPPAMPHTPKLPAGLLPSSAAPLEAATVGCTLNIGPRIGIKGACDDQDLGNALHAIYAADLPDRRATMDRRLTRARRLLNAHGISANLEAAAVIGGADRFYALIEKEFGFFNFKVEVPFEHPAEDGRRVSGFIDLVLETNAGWLVIDHKSFPGGQKDVEAKALTYSGQLACYGRALAAAGHPVRSLWIHFPISGLLVELLVPDASPATGSH